MYVSSQPLNHLQSVAAMKENDVIAVIIIILFLVLALIAFGIYRLVHMVRTQGSVTTSSTGSSGDIVDG
ncbi:hypothetical protein SLS62_010386 [Diatrype stigma]|uniref:Uncharacterized protein n=1 Tax=Diatrype stigma TaxID=117547 RepID=A0AAN9UBT9_9PEZI